MRFIPFILLLSLAACSNKESPAPQSNTSGAKPQSDNSDSGSKDETVTLGGHEFTLAAQEEVSSATISDLKYNAAKHSISMQLSYPGCSPVVHKLKLSSACAESYPMQCAAALIRPASDKASCALQQTETLELALETNYNELVLRIYTTEKQAAGQVLVDREGRVEQLTTPP